MCSSDLVNVDARATTPTNAFTLTDAKTYDGGTSVSVFDSLGREHVMAMYFRKNGVERPVGGSHPHSTLSVNSKNRKSN